MPTCLRGAAFFEIQCRTQLDVPRNTNVTDAADRRHAKKLT